jgi:hypothetical protein
MQMIKRLRKEFLGIIPAPRFHKDYLTKGDSGMMVRNGSKI